LLTWAYVGRPSSVVIPCRESTSGSAASRMAARWAGRAWSRHRALSVVMAGLCTPRGFAGKRTLACGDESRGLLGFG
jgi:hypothetical protein